jgi:hypothetical protein
MTEQNKITVIINRKFLGVTRCDFTTMSHDTVKGVTQHTKVLPDWLRSDMTHNT